MKSHGMNVGQKVEIGCYLYEITDEYQLKVIGYKDEEIDLITNNARGESRPTTKTDLPYSGDYYFYNGPIYTQYYFNEPVSEVLFSISLDKGYGSEKFKISVIDGRNNDAMQINDDVTVSSSYVTGVYFYIYPNQDFYFSLDNVNGTLVKGTFTVSAGL